MSLSLTPLNEAWNIPKVKKKKEQNTYTKTETQKEMLIDANLEVNNNIPSGNNNIDVNYHKPLQEQQVETNDNKQSLTVQITDSEVIQLLNRYNMSYIKDIINKSVKKYLNSNTVTNNNSDTNNKSDTEEYVETFKGFNSLPSFKTQDSNMYIYILLALIVLDIILRN